MKTLLAMLALAILLALPASAQTRQTREQSYESSRQAARTGPVRHAQGRRDVRMKPCVVYTWVGCLGWDPDPRVRMMILHDSAIDDD